MLGPIGRNPGQIGIVLMAGLLILSGPGSALVTPGADSVMETSKEAPGPLYPDKQRGDPTGVPAAGAPPSILTQFDQWLSWSHAVSLDTLVRHAHDEAPATGQMLIPKPDAFPGYALMDDEDRREAWQSWWMATLIAAMRVPSVGLDPAGHAPYGAMGMSSQQGAQAQVEQAKEDDDVSPLGDPHSLDRLWRLQAHGPPRIVLPAGNDEQMYLVTDRGVIFVPEAGAQPSWMLNLEGVAGHAEVIKRDEGNHDLVVGMHSLDPEQSVASIWVIDGEEERVSFAGLRGERSLLHWTLTDVDGDGDKDILGIDRSGNISALKLDGSEIYRKPVPQPDLPHESTPPQSTPDPLPDIPSLPVLALVRTGAEIFGDATGDGTMDIYATSFWGAAGLDQTAWVTLIEGATGDEVWSEMIDQRVDKISRVATATVTGDLNEDGLADVAVWEYGFSALTLSPAAIAVFLLEGPRNTYFAGEDGSVLARDQSSLAIQTAHGATELLGELAYHVPLAFSDLNGDGQNTIIAIEANINDQGEFTQFFPALQERVWTDIPGGPTTMAERHELDLATSFLPASMVQFSVREVDDKDLFIFLAPDWATPQGEPGVLFTLGEDGFNQVSLPEPIGHYDINPQTGQRFAWTLADDRFTPVDANVQATGNGTRMIMSAEPLLAQSLDGGVPDLLIPRTLGYFWVSGRTGAILETVDRPLGTSVMEAAEHDGRALVLEHHEENDAYVLFDVREEEPIGSVSASSLPDWATFEALVDVDGNGALDGVFQAYGFSGIQIGGDGQGNDEDEWVIYSFEKGQTIWSYEQDRIQLYFDQFLPDTPDKQILMVYQGEDRMALHTLNGTEPVWSEITGFVWELEVDNGMIAMLHWDPEDDEEKLTVYDGSTGAVRFSASAEDEDNLVWLQFVTNPDGRPLLVHSYASGSTFNPDELAQYVVVTDLSDGRESVRFDVAKPRVVEEHDPDWDWTFTVVEHAMPGVVVGDWNNDGWADLALREGGWPSVRSLKDGSVVAVGPVRGSFTHAIDLNQDGNYEVGLLSAGSLRMYAHDPSLQQLEREDPMERVDAVNPDEGDNETSSRFFDREEERSPGPGVLLVLVVAAIAGVFALRRRNAA